MDFPLILKLSSVQHNENGNIWKAKSITSLKRILMRNVTSFHFIYTSPLIKFWGGGRRARYSAATTATAAFQLDTQEMLIKHIMSHTHRQTHASRQTTGLNMFFRKHLQSKDCQLVS